MTKILIIDDNTDIRYTVSEICSFAGWEVETAVNGEDGLKKAIQYNPDIIIIDYHMPVMDGMQTVKKIRLLGQTPIIVLTVDERQAVADEFLLSGATDFALKPIKAPDLIARVKVNLRVGELLKESIKRNEEVFITKGINPGTLKLIMDFMEQQATPLTIEEITVGIGLAYQTVHRYLLYLSSENKVESDSNYGKVGRPKNKYILRG